MTPQKIASAWKSAFGSIGPAGFLCREAIPDRWVRIHSLPESKRYPEDEAERMEIARRHLIVADSTLGNAECILFVARFGPSADPANVDLPGFDDSDFLRLNELEIEDEDDPIHFFGMPFRSNHENLRPLILAAAEDATGPILVANFELGTAYAPYDGGADIFFPSKSSAAQARTSWAPWLSSREDGL